MISAVIGLLAALLGLCGMVYWRQDLLAMFRGLAPLSLFFGGVVALIAGLTSMQSGKPDRKSTGGDKKSAA